MSTQQREEAHHEEFVALVAAGRQALADGDLDSARARFEEAARRFSQDPLSHNNLGAFYIGLGEYELAEGSFLHVVDLLPDNPSSHFNLAMARYRQGRFAEAAEGFAAVAARTPEDPEVFNNLGATRYLVGQVEQARQDLETALRLQPNFPNAVLNLCDLEYGTGNVDAAIALCEAYLEHNQDLGVLRRLLEILDEQATVIVNRAIPHAEACVAANDQDQGTRRHLGRLLEARQALTARG
jgi:Flp pilus assembly protein TadD